MPYQLYKSATVLADFARFVKGAGAFAVEATEVALDILDVVFEIATDDVRIVPRRLRITWQKRTGRGEAGLCETRARDNQEYRYSPQ